MKKYQLGEFEEIVILTIAILYNEAYGVAIRNEIESRLSRKVSMGAMHTALVRLEHKGYIVSMDGEATEERMGRPRKHPSTSLSSGCPPRSYSTSPTLPLWMTHTSTALKPGSWKSCQC